MGLRVVERIDFGLLVNMDTLTEYLLAQLLLTSADVRSGVQALNRYASVTFGPCAFEVAEDEGRISVRFSGPDGASLPGSSAGTSRSRRRCVPSCR